MGIGGSRSAVVFPLSLDETVFLVAARFFGERYQDYAAFDIRTEEPEVYYAAAWRSILLNGYTHWHWAKRGVNRSWLLVSRNDGSRKSRDLVSLVASKEGAGDARIRRSSCESLAATH